MTAKTDTKKRTIHIYPNLPFVLAVFLLISSSAWLTTHNRPAAQVGQQSRGINSQSSLLDGQWSYLAGASKHGSELHITNTSLAIVEQDGTGGQPNPPVNLFGTHLEQAKDFRITARLKNIRGKATIQLYGQTPIIADEFRIERKSIRVTIQGPTAQVDVWDGSRQDPVTTQIATVKTDDNHTNVTIRHENNKLYVSMNSKVIASLRDYDLFADGTIWFGMDATHSWDLASLQAIPLSGGVLRVADSSTLKVVQQSDGLQRLAQTKRPNFMVGAAMSLGPLATDSALANIALGGNFGLLTTENALKWQAVHPLPNVYTFDDAEALLVLAKRNNLAIHGHTLVFGEANPRWVQDLPTNTTTDKAAVTRIMENHITTVVGHFKGKIGSWDVVNEPIADYDSFDLETNSVLRNNKWFQAMGEEYIATAFRAARAADPDALLFMNEYGLEEDGARWITFLALVKRLKAQGVPIDGVGFQAHVYNPNDRISAGTLRKHIQELAAIGVVSRVSENDIYAYGGSAAQAQQYADVFNACLTEPACIHYTTWGVSDRYNTYRDDDGNITYGQDFLWSDAMRPTPAVTKLQLLLKD